MQLKTKVMALATATALLFSSVHTLAKTYKHELGEVSIEKVPQRVVVLGYASLDVLDALEIDPIAIPKKLLPSNLSQYKADKYTNTGSLQEVNYETLFKLKPDLIIAEARMAKIYKDLSEVAPTYLFKIDNNDYWHTTKQNWANLGEIFNKQNKAEQLINEVETKISALNKKTNENKSKTLTVMSNGNNISMFGPSSRFSFIYQEAGFTPSTSEQVNAAPRTHGDLISFEYIADAKPDTLLILDREQAIGKSTGKAKSLFNNELINSTPAAKNKHIIYLDPAAWYLAAGGYQSILTMIDDLNKAVSE